MNYMVKDAVWVSIRNCGRLYDWSEVSEFAKNTFPVIGYLRALRLRIKMFQHGVPIGKTFAVIADSGEQLDNFRTELRAELNRRRCVLHFENSQRWVFPDGTIVMFIDARYPDVVRGLSLAGAMYGD